MYARLWISQQYITDARIHKTCVPSIFHIINLHVTYMYRTLKCHIVTSVRLLSLQSKYTSDTEPTCILEALLQEAEGAGTAEQSQAHIDSDDVRCLFIDLLVAGERDRCDVTRTSRTSGHCRVTGAGRRRACVARGWSSVMA